VNSSARHFWNTAVISSPDGRTRRPTERVSALAPTQWLAVEKARCQLTVSTYLGQLQRCILSDLWQAGQSALLYHAPISWSCHAHHWTVVSLFSDGRHDLLFSLGAVKTVGRAVHHWTTGWVNSGLTSLSTQNRSFQGRSSQHWYWQHKITITQTRRPASADRTAHAANFRRDLEAT